MQLKYLLDTNVISALIKDPFGPVADRISGVGEGAICTSVVVAAELRYGGIKSASRQLADRIETTLSALEVLPFTSPADRHYAAIRHHLTQNGNVIGPNDMLIAAHALAANLKLVTANVREFKRVPALETENWLHA